MAAKNIRVVFLLPPSVIGNPGDKIDAPPGNPLLAYDNLDRYPQFYAEENRMDRWHLNARGADLFSQKLARILSRLWTRRIVRQSRRDRSLAPLNER